MLEIAEKIIQYLGCPCDVFAPAQHDEALLAAYHKAVEEGREGGFTPLLIVPDEILWAEQLEEDLAEGDVAALRAERLLEAESLDPEEYFAEYYEEEKKPEPGPIMGDNIISYFSAHWDYENKRTHEVILAKIPSTKPWELAVWLPMGGFNDCPGPIEQAAIMKRWHERYGAVPALVTSDTWEFTVPSPVATAEEALALAYEHYAFCPDRAEAYARDVYTLGNLADSLMKSRVWYFWWD